MPEKKGVIIYYKYRTMLELLSNEERGEILMASLAYDEKGDLAVFKNPAAEMLFTMMRMDFDALSEAYSRRIEAQIENGRKGGRPSKPNETQITHGLSDKPNETQKSHGLSDKPNETQKSHNDNDNDKDKDKDNDKDKDTHTQEEPVACVINFKNPNQESTEGFSDYPHRIFNAWLEVPGAPSPGDFFRFNNYHMRQILPAVTGIHSDDVLGAISNYARVKAMEDTWWESNPGIIKFFESSLDKFLPQNFKLGEFVSREARDKAKDREYYQNLAKGGS